MGKSQRYAARQARREAAARQTPRGRGFYLRAGLLGTIVAVIAVAAVALAVARFVGPAASDPNAFKIQTSMDGFSPNAMTAKAGATVAVDLVDMDSSMHSDGGGKHSFNIDALNVHEIVQPESDLVFSFAAPTKPGTYDFYCDICCGGKENPSMHGTLTVTA